MSWIPMLVDCMQTSLWIGLSSYITANAATDLWDYGLAWRQSSVNPATQWRKYTKICRTEGFRKLSRIDTSAYCMEKSRNYPIMSQKYRPRSNANRYRFTRCEDLRDTYFFCKSTIKCTSVNMEWKTTIICIKRMTIMLPSTTKCFYELAGRQLTPPLLLSKSSKFQFVANTMKKFSFHLSCQWTACRQMYDNNYL